MLFTICLAHKTTALVLFAGKPCKPTDINNPDWVPNQKLGHGYSETKPESRGRHERVLEREEKRKRSESALALLELSQADRMAEEEKGIGCQTELTVETISEYEKLKKGK